MNNKISKKHAIIGCGRIAPNHIFGCQSNGIEVAKCYDLKKEKAEKFAEKYSVNKVAESFEEVLEDPEITSVSICTDHGSHARLTIQALNAGKNVVVEKPMALSVTDAQEMIDTAKRNNRTLCVISQHRYNDMIRYIRSLIKNGELGDITVVNATLNSSKKVEYYTESGWRGTLEKEGGSTLINQGIHTLDLVVWFLGAPTELLSYKTNLKFKGIIETEDTLASIMKFENGGLGVFSSTNTSVDEWDSKIEFIGMKGSITFSTGFPARILSLEHENEEIKARIRAELDKYLENDMSADNLPPTMNYYGTTHREQMADFFKVSNGEKEKLDIDPAEGMKTLDVVLRMYNSN